MNRKNSLLLQFSFVCIGVGGAVTPAAAEDSISVSAGIRLWSSNWQGSSFQQVGGKTVAVYLNSSATTVAMPIVSVRYGDFGVSLSQFRTTNFSLSDGLSTYSVARSEYDVNALYTLIPGLSIGIGYKQLKFPGVDIKGPTISLSGSAPIGEKLGVYATGGIGRLGAELNSSQKKLSTDYLLGEFGLSYSLVNDQRFLKSLVATLGYRNQKVTVRSVPFLDGRSINDTTSGPTFGLIGLF